jgi:hypothetical protein
VAAHDRQAREPEREVDEEDPAPVERRGERSADQRADGERARHRRAVGGQRPPALLGARERVRQHGQRDREHERRADALRGTRGDQRPDRLRRRAQQRRRGEDADAEREQPPAAEAVGQRAGGQHGRRQGKRVGVDDPLQAGQSRAEVGRDR